MLFLFYGPDEFRIGQKIKEITDEYHKKYPTIEIGRINSADLLKEEFKKLYLFAAKRLFIINNKSLNLAESETYFDIIKKQKITEDLNSFVIFIFSKPDYKNKLFQYLLKNSKSQFFEILNFLRLKKYILDDLMKNNFEIAPGIAEKIIFLCDNSFENIFNELDKIKIYKHNEKKIKEEDLEKIFSSNTADINIFNLLDAISERNKKNIFNLLEQYNLNNDDHDKAFYQVLGQLKKLFIIKSFLQENPSYQGNLAVKFNLHPFVIKKILPNIKKFSCEELKNLLLEFFKSDQKIKTGRLKSADLLSRLLMEI